MTLYAADDFILRAKRLLSPEPPVSWNVSDDDMNQKARLIPEGVQPKPAAVLVPVVQRGDDLTLLLTQRSAQLSTHAGQIAFPGGRIDAGETVVQAALRETFEETGITADHITPLGFLDGYLTVTSYLVAPVVALVQPDFKLHPQAGEVEEIFEVPLSFLMNPSHCETHSKIWQGRERFYYVYNYQQRVIWGATAGMITHLYRRLYA